MGPFVLRRVCALVNNARNDVLAVAPDSNVNAATSARAFPSRIRNPLTGESLEFRLGDEDRETSGIGAVISASAQYLHPVGFRPIESSATRLRLGGSLYRREYGGQRFNDMILAVYTGPQLLFPRARASLQGGVGAVARLSEPK